jgi:ferredoxin
MKHYDGTEPTVRRRLPYGADQQGRYPEAAEPCTDVCPGALDEKHLFQPWFGGALRCIHCKSCVVAAEAVTDVGQEEKETEDTMWFWVVVVAIFTAVVVAAAWEGMA